MDLFYEARKKCYHCYRPMSSCMCRYVQPVESKTKFVILMHPKEFKKIKNGTGHLTHLSLKNSELHIGIDFSKHNRINALIDDPQNVCFLLYPTERSRLLNDGSVSSQGKTTIVFILDATWDCSRKMLRVSENLQQLDAISFQHTKVSQFAIKEQPDLHCLSTIESTLCVLELMNENRDETIKKKGLEHFLDPFKAMIKYQQSCIDETGSSYKNSVRFKKRGS